MPHQNNGGANPSLLFSHYPPNAMIALAKQIKRYEIQPVALFDEFSRPRRYEEMPADWASKKWFFEPTDHAAPNIACWALNGFTKTNSLERLEDHSTEASAKESLATWQNLKDAPKETLLLSHYSPEEIPGVVADCENFRVHPCALFDESRRSRRYDEMPADGSKWIFSQTYPENPSIACWSVYGFSRTDLWQCLEDHSTEASAKEALAKFRQMRFSQEEKQKIAEANESGFPYVVVSREERKKTGSIHPFFSLQEASEYVESCWRQEVTYCMDGMGGFVNIKDHSEHLLHGFDLEDIGEKDYYYHVDDEREVIRDKEPFEIMHYFSPKRKHPEPPYFIDIYNIRKLIERRDFPTLEDAAFFIIEARNRKPEAFGAGIRKCHVGETTYCCGRFIMSDLGAFQKIQPGGRRLFKFDAEAIYDMREALKPFSVTSRQEAAKAAEQENPVQEEEENSQSHNYF